MIGYKILSTGRPFELSLLISYLLVPALIIFVVFTALLDISRIISRIDVTPLSRLSVEQVANAEYILIQFAEPPD